MQSTERRKYRIKRRIIGRVIWRLTIYIAMAVILTAAWKVVSVTVRQTARKSGQEAIQDQTEKFASEDNSGLAKVSAGVKDILLVNKEHPLEDSYKPRLQKIKEYGVNVDSSIYEALNHMLHAGEKEGLSFWIASGYRSMERQRELLDEDIEELMQRGYSVSEAYEEVIKETMPVGCSEHATGLAVDIVAKDYQILDEKQARTEEIKWLQENCSQYGFILRYPKGKEDITKVSYESWHFRYVGVDAAKEIMSQGITLEEYLQFQEDR